MKGQVQMRKYNNDYTFIYNASVFHDDMFNGGAVDPTWAEEFANIYFGLTHPEGYTKPEKEEFMYGWHEFWHNTFN